MDGAVQAETVSALLYRQVREERDTLLEELRQLRERDENSVVPGPRWPRLHLSRLEERLLSLLFDKKGIVHRDTLAAQACLDYENTDGPYSVLSLRICRLRKKIWLYGGQIICHKELGYELPSSVRRALAKAERRPQTPRVPSPEPTR